MLKKAKNNKGFTLIELLATIVILGVLMIVAIPMVTKYIQSAKQDAFVDTAKAYITSARYSYLNGDYIYGNDTGGTCAAIDGSDGGTIYIPFSAIDVDKTGGKSSFGGLIDEDNSYVQITASSDGTYTYSVAMYDSKKYGTGKEFRPEATVNKTLVVANSEKVSLPSGAKTCYK